MPSFEEFHIQPTITETLQQLGWTPGHPLVRETTPTSARGHNLVVITPPVPSYATPALAGILSRVEDARRTLLLVPAAQVDEWGSLVHRLSQGTGLRIQVARGTARAMRRLRADDLDLVVATPETALSLVTRSALQMDSVTSFMLAWPELMPTEEVITPLMQDLPREAQRVVYTAESSRVGGVIERYARKALMVGALDSKAAPAGPVRSVSVAWSGRLRALADLIELLDPASLAVWTVDRRHHDSIAQWIAAIQPEVQLVTGDAPPVSTIIAFDLPTGQQLQQLLGAGEVVLLVPPGTESYLARIAAPRRPLQLPGVLDEARSAEGAQRTRIVEVIESGRGHRALLTLAPLFERYDPATVAAALFEVWTGSAPSAAPAPPPVAATSRVYVGIGKKDGATANDLVAVLTKELRVDRTKIGRIELRETYSLIELPAQEAEHLAGALNGITIRRRRVTARVDRGPSGPPKSDGRTGVRSARRVDRS